MVTPSTRKTLPPVPDEWTRADVRKYQRDLQEMQPADLQDELSMFMSELKQRDNPEDPIAKLYFQLASMVRNEISSREQARQ